MQKAELMPLVYRKIRAYLNPKPYQKLSFIDTKSPQGTVGVTKREQVEEILLKHHLNHFTKAKNTTLATKEVINRFGLATDTIYASNFHLGNTSELQY